MRSEELTQAILSGKRLRVGVRRLAAALSNDPSKNIAYPARGCLSRQNLVVSHTHCDETENLTGSRTKSATEKRVLQPANRTQQSRFALPAKDSEGGVHPGKVFGFVVLVCTLRDVLFAVPTNA